jgi:hypothetical protein
MNVNTEDINDDMLGDLLKYYKQVYRNYYSEGNYDTKFNTKNRKLLLLKDLYVRNIVKIERLKYTLIYLIMSVCFLALRYFDIVGVNASYIILGILFVIYFIFVFIVNENVVKKRYNLNYKTFRYNPPDVTNESIDDSEQQCN